MSQENVDTVRRIYEEELLDHHPERLLPLMDPDVEYVNPPEAVEPGTRRGVAEMARAAGNIQAGFEHAQHELRDVIGTGDVIVASVSFVTRGRGSDSEVVQEEAHTWTFRDGRIVRFEWGRNLPAALEAAGISGRG
jgi:ketosteroid isomerase-like protein